MFRFNQGNRFVKTTLHFVLISIFTLFTSALFAGERIGDFALIDNEGTQHHMAWYDDQNAVVILPQAVGATDTDALAALQDLEAKYAEQGVVFFLMNPGMQILPRKRELKKHPFHNGSRRSLSRFQSSAEKSGSKHVVGDKEST